MMLTPLDQLRVERYSENYFGIKTLDWETDIRPHHPSKISYCSIHSVPAGSIEEHRAAVSTCMLSSDIQPGRWGRCYGYSMRGVPEGTVEDWAKVLACMRARRQYNTKRLAWDPRTKMLISRKNTNPGDEYEFTSPTRAAAHIERLIWEVVEQTQSQYPTEVPA